jgi:hypothetical protein
MRSVVDDGALFIRSRDGCIDPFKFLVMGLPEESGRDQETCVMTESFSNNESWYRNEGGPWL